MMSPIRVIVIGGGGRGSRYARIMGEMPDKFQVIAVAEPRRTQRELFQQVCGVAAENFFEDWHELLSQPKMADLAVIATQDNMHYEPAMAAIEQGYHLLLEKPIAQTAQQCADIANAAERKGVKALVCHVLRFAPFYGKIKELLRSGIIGRPMTINMVEGARYINYSRGYIRGKWHSEKETSPMLMAKCCHDLDMIQWLMDKPCRKVQSFGDLTYFTAANAPEGAPIRCADGGCPVADTCPFNCIKLSFEHEQKHSYRRDATFGVSKDREPTDEEVMQGLKTTDYGLCVFHANNDVVDHQTVNMEFEGGATATLTMNAFNEGGRHIRIFGTKGELYAYAKDTEITVFTFEDGKQHKFPVVRTDESINGGHGGGDQGIVRELYEYLSGTYTGFRAADISTSVKNHLIGFAAEEGRHSDRVMDLNEYFARYGIKNEY